MALKSAQAKALRQRLFAQMVGALALYALAFAAAAALVEALAVPSIAEYVADATSEWHLLSEGEYLEFQERIRQTDDGAWDIWPMGDDTYAVRDLTVYHALRNLKMPAALGLFLLGCLGIVFAVLNRSIRHFDELSRAVTALFDDRNKAVALPDSLAIARAELNEIRIRSLADERAAQAAERRKNELVAYLAHDVKTPLTSVLGYLSLLRESPDLPVGKRAEYAGIAFEKAERLESLIDEFFEITRYNLQAIPLERQRIGIALLCHQIADEFFPEADGRNVRIEVDAPAGELVFADPDKLARALSNVVRNAVAYADAHTTIRLEARIEPTARRTGEDDWRDGFSAGQSAEASSPAASGPLAVFSVTNRGREISPVHLQSIFEKFYREDASRATGGGGAGLGLAIAKEIVLAHGGDISARSEAGLTVFVLRIPQGIWQNGPAPAGAKPDAAPRQPATAPESTR